MSRSIMKNIESEKARTAMKLNKKTRISRIKSFATPCGVC